MTRPTSDVVFTPAVKAQQSRLGSRALYATLEGRGGWNDRVTHAGELSRRPGLPLLRDRERHGQATSSTVEDPKDS